MKPSDRLAQLNLILPAVAAPVGSYVPATIIHGLVLTSGQLPLVDGKLTCTGKVPTDVSLEDAAKAAEIATLNAIAAAASVTGGIDNLKRIIRVCVYVNSRSGFTDQPKVANGASDWLARIFGESGRHVRSALGAAALPLNAPVEVELIAEVSQPF